MRWGKEFFCFLLSFIISNFDHKKIMNKVKNVYATGFVRTQTGMSVLPVCKNTDRNVCATSL